MMSRRSTAVLTAAILATGACGGGAVYAGRSAGDTPAPASGAAASGDGTALVGVVLRRPRAGAEPVPVPHAAVWTAPESDQVFSDSLGRWTISSGLAQRQYRVMASLDNLRGRSQQFTPVMNAATTVAVILGDDETTWPPPEAFEKFMPKANRGLPKGRVVPPEGRFRHDD